MKKTISSLLVLGFLATTCSFAMDVNIEGTEFEIPAETEATPIEPRTAAEPVDENVKVLDEHIESTTEQVQPIEEHARSIANDAPVWEDYVAPKYRNPRTDFTRGGAIAETAIGGILTALIITCPIGIPMTIHGTTKIKMVSYANRKEYFDQEIEKAKLIKNDQERQAAYQHILDRCNLKETTKAYYAKKAQKD